MNPRSERNPSTTILHRLAQLLAGFTFVLLVAGALVTSTGSGLAVPDWPLAFGRLFPPMVGGVLYEHGHRLIAGGVAALTLILCIGLLAREDRAWVRRMGLAAFAVVCLQAVLGGLTVLLHLPPAISIAHAGLAEIFFAFIVCLTIVTSSTWRRTYGIRFEEQDRLTLQTLCLTATIVVYLQILLGAVVRHTNSGIFIHILGALATLFFVGRMAYFINSGYAQYPILRRPAMAAAHLVGVQLILGSVSWVEKIKNAGAGQPSAGKIWFSTIHLAAGALLFATCVTLTWRIFKIACESRRPLTIRTDTQEKVLA